MVEDSPPQKNDEQFPLLKVEAGGGDSGRALPPVNTPGWNVACSNRSWLDRWPELVSACWMTGMLLGIFFLILYGLGLGVIQRRPILILECNESKPASQVYYHHIVQHGNDVPFAYFSEYLSNIASLYSSLRFNVFFLIDDSHQNGYRGSRHSRFFTKLIPYRSIIEPCVKFNDNNKEVKDFNLKYQNVNVTIMPLSRYMHMTPLRYKWRTISMAYLPFYMRVFSVWQNGGIGIDLDVFSNQYNRRQLPDRRITAILKQHNKGIKPDGYANVLNKIVQDEQNEFLSWFHGILDLILNESYRVLQNHTVPYLHDFMEKDVKPIETSKNDSSNIVDFNKTTTNNITNNIDLSVVQAVVQADANLNNSSMDIEINTTNDLEQSLELYKIKLQNTTKDNTTSNKNISESSQVVLLYDFSLFSDNSMGPSYFISNPIKQTVLQHTNDVNSATNLKSSQFLLSITGDGSFVASSSKQHPFLSHIISAGCQRIPPRFAIQDAIVSQCSTMFRDDVYCSNIFIL